MHDVSIQFPIQLVNLLYFRSVNGKLEADMWGGRSKPVRNCENSYVFFPFS